MILLARLPGYTTLSTKALDRRVLSIGVPPGAEVLVAREARVYGHLTADKRPC